MADIKTKGPRARAVELREHYRLTAGDIALATATDERTVRRWTSTTESRRSSADDRIRRLEKVIEALHDAGLNREAVRVWLREPADYLANRSPLEALGAEDFDAVEQFIDVSTLGISTGRSDHGGGARKSSPRQAVIRS
jgi:uncharacterized protein (DUF2384 family)